MNNEIVIPVVDSELTFKIPQDIFEKANYNEECKDFIEKVELQVGHSIDNNTVFTLQ